MASDALLFNYHDALIYEGDARLFRAPGWLNDRCLNFFFRLLEHEEFPDRPDLLFLDPVVVSCMLIQCTGPFRLHRGDFNDDRPPLLTSP